jgi:hypothetical protein
MRVFRFARILAETIVLTGVWFVLIALGLASLASVTGAPPHLGPETILLVLGLMLWLAFRWAVPTVDWIERRFWEHSRG